MKSFRTYRFVLYCFILFGLFANFAQNQYGLTFIFGGELILGFLVLIEGWIRCREIWNTSKLRGLYFLSEHFWFFIFATGFFFKSMRWPGAGPLLTLGGGFLALHLIFQGIRYLLIKSQTSIVKRIAILLFLFVSSASILGILFKTMHWPFATDLMIFSISLISLFLILFLTFQKTTQKEKLDNFILSTRNIPGSASVAFLYFTFWCVYSMLAGYNILPKFYSLQEPVAAMNLIQQNQSAKADAYFEAYENFIYKVTEEE